MSHFQIVEKTKKDFIVVFFPSDVSEEQEELFIDEWSDYLLKQSTLSTFSFSRKNETFLCLTLSFKKTGKNLKRVKQFCYQRKERWQFEMTQNSPLQYEYARFLEWFQPQTHASA